MARAPLAWVMIAALCVIGLAPIAAADPVTEAVSDYWCRPACVGPAALDEVTDPWCRPSCVPV